MTNLEMVQQEISKMTAEQFSEVFSDNSAKYLCSKIPSAQCIYNTSPFGTCAECIANWLNREYVKTFSNSKSIDFDSLVENYNCDECKDFQDRSKFIEQQIGEWIRHKPDAETMRAFHAAGIGKAMDENSIFWTCSICGGWGTPNFNYCSQCGAKMNMNEH